MREEGTMNYALKFDRRSFVIGAATVGGGGAPARAKA
jgi:hypothetical protein